MASDQRSAGPANRWRSDGRTSSGCSNASPEDTSTELIVDPGSDGNELLDLLKDSYVHRILTALDDGPRPARELAEACNSSRSTVYRKLNRLEERGLVVADVEMHQEGHHRKVFTSAFQEATIELASGPPRVKLVLAEDQDDEKAVGESPARLPAD